MKKKYELTDETINIYGNILHRIKALIDFSDVKKGDLGGFIASEDNLSHEGNCWIYDTAWVFQHARILENAKVHDCVNIRIGAKVSGNARISGWTRVISNSQISGNAQISGESAISEDIKLTSGVWSKTLSETIGSKRIAYLFSSTLQRVVIEIYDRVKSRSGYRYYG